MKLTAEQIQFIDTYLKNSGVEYVDIRFEMTDHVATALEEEEGDFMEHFKRYMIYHKRNLLSGNRRFKQLAVKRATAELCKTLYGFWVLPALLILVFGTHYFFADINLSDAACYLRILFFAAYFTGMAVSYNKGKYSVTSKLYGVCGLVLYYAGMIVAPERLIPNLWVVFTIYSVIILMGCALSITAIRLHKHYKTRYAA